MCQVYLPKLVCIQNLDIILKLKLFPKLLVMWIMTAFPERKDKIEDGNKILVQKFQSELNQQLEILHKTLAVSVTQQEQQLKDMEEDMQSFVSTKAEVRSKQYGYKQS